MTVESYRTRNELSKYLAYLRNFGRRILGIQPRCMVEGCDRKAVDFYGPIGRPVRGTGELVKVGETSLVGDDSWDVVRWTGRKKYGFVWECGRHL